MKDIGNKKVMADNLKFYMNQSNVSAKELSRALNFPYTTVMSWLKAENYPRIDKIEMIAEYFDILKSDLIESKADSSAVEIPASLSEAHQKILEITKTLTESEAYQALQTLNLIVKGLRK